MSTELERLYSQLRSLESQIANTPQEASDYQFNQIHLSNLKSRIQSITNETFGRYREMLTRAHLVILKQLKDANHEDFLLRRAYVLAYSGCICSALFERDEFRELKQYFPVVKLPLFIEDQDAVQFNNLFCRQINLDASINNNLLDFQADRKAKPEENLRTMLWAPILKEMFNSLKWNLGIEGLNMMAEFNTRNIPDFNELRFIDLAVAAAGSEGLPILLVEISASPVHIVSLYKDFRKMAMAMTFVLMEKIKRAEVHCPNDDISKFQIFGILISGYSFEFCIGTVAKDNSGRISFMFHSNTNDWKFSLDNSRNDLSVGEYICVGNTVIVGSHGELYPPQQVAEDGIEAELFGPPIIDVIVESEEEEQTNPEIYFLNLRNVEPRLVLWKFLLAMGNYYKNLPECMQECIKFKPPGVSETSGRYTFLPKDLRPPISSSSSTHTGPSPQLLPNTIHVSAIVNSPTLVEMYKLLWNSKLPTLPKVILWDEAKITVTLCESKFLMCDYMEMIESRKDFGRPQLSCIAAKFILDMLIAAYELHKRGLVCGGFFEYFIRYDGMFWYLYSLSRLRTIKEAEEFGPISPQDRIEAECHLRPSQILGQKDDLYGIIRTFMFYCNDRFRNIIYDSFKYPLFDQFKKETYLVMNYIKDHPASTAESILLKAIPAYNNLVDGTELDESLKNVFATQIMANRILSEMFVRRGSISMHSIHSTTSESSED